MESTRRQTPISFYKQGIDISTIHVHLHLVRLCGLVSHRHQSAESVAQNQIVMKKTTLVLTVLVGIMLGLGGFTFYFGEGHSYLSKNPEACLNCHIMRPQFDSWQKASHHTAATCVQCHLPQNSIYTYVSKAENGFNHSTAFTLQNFDEPITITEKNSQILQQNCIYCHDGITENLTHGSTTDADAISCVHCHQTVGHGERLGLGGPLRHEEKGGIEQ